MSRFKYESRSKEEHQARANKRSSRYDSWLTEDLPFFKPRNGENCIRLIPWLERKEKGDEGYEEYKEYRKNWGGHWGIDIRLHRNVGVDNGNYLCLQMKGQECPICSAWKGEGLEELKTSDRVLAWLIDRNDEKAGPMLWSMPLGTSNDITKVSEVRKRGGGANDGEWLEIANWRGGYDVFFDKEGEKERTRYARPAVDREPTDLTRDDDQEEEWLSYVFSHRLPDLLKFYEADYLEKVLSGQKERGDRDEQDSNADRGVRRRPSDDRGASGDREERVTRRTASREDDDSDRPARRRDADAEGSEPARRGREGDREERPVRRGDSEGSESSDDRPRASRRRGEEDPPWEGRDKEAESENEGREARRRPLEEDQGESRAERAKPREEVEEEPTAERLRRNVGRRR